MERPKFVSHFIELAKKVSRSGLHPRHLVGAVLVKNGNMIATGSNSHKTHPLMGNRTMHAEVTCLIGKRYSDLKGSTMFVARTSKVQRNVGMARPCATCRGILSHYGIKKVYFTSENGVVEHIKL